MILLNGIDIRKFDYQEYLSLFSIVFQDFHIFSFPLGENVAANQTVDREQAIDALKKAGLEEFLDKPWKVRLISFKTSLSVPG